MMIVKRCPSIPSEEAEVDRAVHIKLLRFFPLKCSLFSVIFTAKCYSKASSTKLSELGT